MDKSIREVPDGSWVPDFRNLGVILRVLLGGVALAAVASLVAAPRLADWAQTFVAQSVAVVPVLLGTLGVCALLSRPLRRLSGWFGPAVVGAVAATIAMAVADILSYIGLFEAERGLVLRAALLALSAAALLLGYFALRERAMRPADAEARFAALSARIRPHFLFNSLNAVMSLIRSDPRRAETALESVADLFRVLVRDPRQLVPLSEEIALCRQYLELERLRLGERLDVLWHIDAVPEDALVPPLMLQPLLENAVYHGIEPAEDGGEIRIGFSMGPEGIEISLENPMAEPGHEGGADGLSERRRNGRRGPNRAGGRNGNRDGNHMAISNIRERLALHFDLEARLETATSDGRFKVRIVLPYRTRS